MAVDKLAEQTARLRQLSLDKHAEEIKLRAASNERHAAVMNRMSEEDVKELNAMVARVSNLMEERHKLDQVLQKVRQQSTVNSISHYQA